MANNNSNNNNDSSCRRRPQPVPFSRRQVHQVNRHLVRRDRSRSPGRTGTREPRRRAVERVVPLYVPPNRRRGQQVAGSGQGAGQQQQQRQQRQQQQQPQSYQQQQQPTQDTATAAAPVPVRAPVAVNRAPASIAAAAAAAITTSTAVASVPAPTPVSSPASAPTPASRPPLPPPTAAAAFTEREPETFGVLPAETPVIPLLLSAAYERHPFSPATAATLPTAVSQVAKYRALGFVERALDSAPGAALLSFSLPLSSDLPFSVARVPSFPSPPLFLSSPADARRAPAGPRTMLLEDVDVYLHATTLEPLVAAPGIGFVSLGDYLSRAGLSHIPSSSLRLRGQAPAWAVALLASRTRLCASSPVASAAGRRLFAGGDVVFAFERRQVPGGTVVLVREEGDPAAECHWVDERGFVPAGVGALEELAVVGRLPVAEDWDRLEAQREAAREARKAAGLPEEESECEWEENEE